MTKFYDTATDLITFARGSSGTALRRVGYGDELVDNDDFASGLTSWEQDDTAFSVVGDELVYDASGSGLRFGQAVNFTAGKVYQLTFDATISSTFRVQLVDQISNDSGAQIILVSVSTGANTVVFVPTSSFTYLVLRRLGRTNNSTFDNVSVKEVIFDRATDPLVLFNHPDDIPRIEYGSDGSLKGLLIEEQRTNLLTYSEDFSHSSWALTFIEPFGSGSTVNATTGPDGQTAADFIRPTTDSTNQHYVRASVGGSVGASYTISVYAKAGGYSSLSLRALGTNAPIVKYDLATGTADDPAGTIQAVGNGWFRCSLTGEATSSSVWHYIYPNQQSTYAGDGTSGIFVWGAQVEEGSFPTSYIPTSGSTVTRSPDIASIPVSAFGYNQDAGTVVVEFNMIADAAGSSSLTQAAFGFHDGTSSNRLELWSSSVGQLTLRDRTASANYDAVSSGNSLEQSTKSAASYASGEASKLVVNGGTALVAGTATTPPAYSTLLLGDTQNINAELNGHIKSIQYYPRRLTDAQLQEITA